EYMDSVKENRTGFTRYSQGLDADSLNKTATGISLITSSSAKRQKLIARMFAETGVKDLMQGIKHLLIKTRSGKPLVMRLRGKWENVDPREWKTQWDMSVNVGLGTNDKTAQAAQLGQIMTVQKELIVAGKAHLVSDQNLYNSAKRLQETAGYKQEGEFFTPPSEQNPPPQPPPDPALIALEVETKVKGEQIASAERIKAVEVQNSQTIAQIQAQANIAVAQIKAETDKSIAAMKSEHDAQMQRTKDESTAQLEIFRSGGKKPGRSGDAEREVVEALVNAIGNLETSTQQMLAAVSSPKEVVRDKAGGIIGVRPRLNS
ncbi:MAG: portal protein, partial [Burkholderiales bacterium]